MPGLIGLAMIVKNEERTLGRCLASVRDAVDEIVVVDTGSTDATKRIAAEYGARVFDFAWIDDFGAARQFAFDQATTDWVFWLDADDVVTGAHHLRSSLAAAPADVAGFYWPYVLNRTASGEPGYSYWRERCVRHDGSFRWVGMVHEVLVARDQRRTERMPEVVVEHHPEPGRRDRPGRNLRILDRQYRANGGALEPRMLFYFGRELADAGESERAIEILEQHAVAGGWADERYHGQLRLARLHNARGDRERAADAYFAAIKIYPRWPEAYFGLAEIAYYQGDWPNVVHWVEIGRGLPLPETLLFVNRRALTYDWLIHYTNALWHTGQAAAAHAWTRHALSMEPNDAWHLQNLTFFASKLGATASEPEATTESAPLGYSPVIGS